MSQILIGIIGCGNIAEKHVQTLQQIDHKVTITGLFDIDNNKSIYLSSKYNLVAYSTLNELISISDLLIICTPHHTHTKNLIEITRAGKYAICEKPLFIDSKDESKFNKDSKRRIFVITQWRFTNAFQKMKGVLQKGTIGQLLFCSAGLNVNRNEAYYSNSDWRGVRKTEGGMLYNQGIHLIDTIVKLLNIRQKYIEIDGFNRKILNNLKLETEDYCSLIFNYNKIPLNIEISTCFPENIQETFIKIVGTKDVVIMKGKTANNIVFLKQSKLNRMKENEDLHLRNIEAIIDFIKMDKKSDLVCNFQEALDTIKLIESIYNFPIQ